MCLQEWRGAKREGSKRVGRACATQPEDPPLSPSKWELAAREEAAFLVSTKRPDGHQNAGAPWESPAGNFVNCAGSVAFACLVTWGKVPTELISFSHRER